MTPPPTFGVELLVTGSGSAQDLVAAIENYAAAGVDVIVYDTIDAQALAPAILALNDAGHSGGVHGCLCL